VFAFIFYSFMIVLQCLCCLFFTVGCILCVIINDDISAVCELMI